VARFAPPSVVPVVNRDYRLGMLTSLQAGLRALGDIAGPVLFTPVDHPAILPGTVAALLRTEAEIAIPRFGGKRGHPVLLGARMAREFLTEPLSSKVRDPIDRHAAEIRYIEVEDPGINDDIDDPALYAALLDRESSRLTGDSL
jgi:CTP:molybdopterin cytidylyltransferase MocA